MKNSQKQVVLRDLRRVPGVGPSIAQDLYDLGIRSVDGLRRRSPERMYEEHCRQKGQRVDRCVLYVFRCAVHFSRTPDPRPDELLWWNWMDTTAGRGRRTSKALRVK